MLGEHPSEIIKRRCQQLHLSADAFIGIRDRKWLLDFFRGKADFAGRPSALRTIANITNICANSLVHAQQDYRPGSIDPNFIRALERYNGVAINVAELRRSRIERM